MLDCWSENPADRPTFTQLRDKFDAIILAENNDMYIQFSSIDTDTPSGYDHLAPVPKEVKHTNVESKSSVALGYDRLAPVTNEANHAEGGSEISSTTFGDHRTSGYYVGESLDSATYDNEPFRVHLGSNPNPYVKTPQSNSRFNLEEVAAEADGEIVSGWFWLSFRPADLQILLLFSPTKQFYTHNEQLYDFIAALICNSVIYNYSQNSDNHSIINFYFNSLNF